MDPPTSLPMPIGAHRDATRLASPPLLPPGVRLRSHGFAAAPHIAFTLSGSILWKSRMDKGARERTAMREDQGQEKGHG